MIRMAGVEGPESASWYAPRVITRRLIRILIRWIFYSQSRPMCVYMCVCVCVCVCVCIVQQYPAFLRRIFSEIPRHGMQMEMRIGEIPVERCIFQRFVEKKRSDLAKVARESSILSRVLASISDSLNGRQ